MRWFWLLFVPAAIYQILAMAAELRYLAKRGARKTFTFQPGISVLKPLRGLDRNTYEAFVSQAQQDYPTFEILFGVRDENDAAAAEVKRLQREFPDKAIRLIAGGEDTPNGKVGVLMELSRHAAYPVRVVNDSDIHVSPAYLSEIVAPLADESIGVVTCLYRANGHTAAAEWEALGIATDFMPSTLVAQAIGVREFGLGSTLVFRAADLEAAGGFAAFSAYLADDYQLAKRITALGKRAVLSSYVVETSLGDASWMSIWSHQLRWARTIRASKGGGYGGLPITHAGIWILLALISAAWIPAASLIVLRVLSALLSAAFVLRCGPRAALCWLSPLWDLYAFCVWVASYAGREVRWRDRTLRIDSEGRIQR